jgi:SulP family sulfate permease
VIKTSENFLEPKLDNEVALFEEELTGIPKNVLIYEINGPLFFGASQKFQEVITDLNKQPDILILRMRNVPFIDATGINRLKEMCQQLMAKGTKIIISEANREVRLELLKAQLYIIIDRHNFVPKINDALERSRMLSTNKNSA